LNYGIGFKKEALTRKPTHFENGDFKIIVLTGRLKRIHYPSNNYNLMKRKKIFSVSFLPIVSVLIIAICLQSCEKDEIDYKLDIPEEFNEVGKLHNQGLDFNFGKIKEATIAFMQEKEASSFKSAKTIDYRMIAHEGTLEFCKTIKYKNNYSIYEYALNYSKPILKSTGLKSMDVCDLSALQAALINQISEILEKKYSDNDIDKLKSDLNNINQAAAMNLTKEEAAVIYCATSLAYNSYQYWMKNYKKWYYTLNYPAILEKFKEEDLNSLRCKNGIVTPKCTSSSNNWWADTWNSVESWWADTTDDLSEWWKEDGYEIVTDDVAGAVTGGMAGVVIATGATASTAGLGAVGYPVAISTGALAGAVYSSTNTIIDNYFER
jgi:hypothetical protein